MQQTCFRARVRAHAALHVSSVNASQHTHAQAGRARQQAGRGVEEMSCRSNRVRVRVRALRINHRQLGYILQNHHRDDAKSFSDWPFCDVSRSDSLCVFALTDSLGAKGSICSSCCATCLSSPIQSLGTTNV